MTKKYEMKQEESKKSHLIIEHLFDSHKKESVHSVVGSARDVEECRN